MFELHHIAQAEYNRFAAQFNKIEHEGATVIVPNIIDRALALIGRLLTTNKTAQAQHIPARTHSVVAR